MAPDGAQGESHRQHIEYDLTGIAASSAGSKSQNLVRASGFKFNKAEKKPLTLKLKRIPSQGKKENNTNGML